MAGVPSQRQAGARRRHDRLRRRRRAHRWSRRATTDRRFSISTGRSRSSCCSSARGGCRFRPTSPRRARSMRRDRDDYQTMFAREEGAVAAPTAALHFTPRLLEALDARGIGRETLTLHVGAGTFLPVKSERIDEHKMHAEWGRIDAATAERLNAVRASGGRLIAVGTTSLRLLESAADERRRHPAVRRRHRDLHHARLSLQGDRRADHQLPFAALDPVHAGQRADGARRHEGGLRPRDRRRATASTPTATRACCCPAELFARLEPVAEVAVDQLAELVDLSLELRLDLALDGERELGASRPRPCSSQGLACGASAASPLPCRPSFAPSCRSGRGALRSQIGQERSRRPLEQLLNRDEANALALALGLRFGGRAPGRGPRSRAGAGAVRPDQTTRSSNTMTRQRSLPTASNSRSTYVP